VEELEHGLGRYVVRYWVDDLMRPHIGHDAILSCAVASLQRAGMRVAVHERRTLTTFDDDAHATRVAARELAKRQMALMHVDLFASLTPEESQALAAQLKHSPYAPGELIVRQGDIAHALVIMVAGEGEVFVTSSEGQRSSVARVHEGSVIGEMGFLTGEPRRASVIARSHVDAYRLDQAAFADIVRARPEIAEALSGTAAARAAALDAELAGHDPTITLGSKTALLHRIRGFFGLAG
jgi:CRP-like cAMP-binding protein